MGGNFVKARAFGPRSISHLKKKNNKKFLDKKNVTGKIDGFKNTDYQEGGKRQPLTKVTAMSIADQPNLEAARKFQQDLLNSFPKRADAILQLVEALASTEKPTSVVELCQEGAFQRTYSNIHKAIDALSAPALVMGCLLSDRPVDKNSPSSENLNPNQTAVDPTLFLEQTRRWTEVFAKQLPNESDQPFRLFALDATPAPKPFAQTMKDRTFVHQAGHLGLPVTIGVQASVLIAVPQKKENEARWPLPLMVDRIPSSETPCQIAEKQLKELSRLSDISQHLCVITADCGYTQLRPQGANQIGIARSRIDRTGRRIQAAREEQPIRRGRPRKYREQVIHFAASIPQEEEGGPDEEAEYEGKSGEHELDILISRWKDMIVHGRDDLVDVVKIEVFLKDDPSRTLFDNPMLLLVSGERRAELTSWQIYQCYLHRFDIEHFFRFQKRQLLFGHYQTAELQRQVNWWWICFMAYYLLYLVRHMAPSSNRPWQRKRDAQKSASPGEVKRVFGAKIFPDLGSPSRKPLNRGKSKGRGKGVRLPPRKRYKPIKKQSETPRAA